MKTSSRSLFGQLFLLILLASLAGPCLCTAGFIMGWGNNNAGQVPGTNVAGSFKAISAGGQHTLGLKTGGTLQVWGYSPAMIAATNSSLGFSNLIAIAAGAYWDLALKADGTLIAVGNVGTMTSSNITAIATGGYHWLAVKADGTVIAGAMYGSTSATNQPPGLAGVTAVAAGYEFSLALKANGRVVGWGSNSYGQSTVPDGLSNVVAVASGYRHGVALKNDGTVVAWGDNTYGQCDVPAGLSEVVAIAAGNWHNVALKSDGTVVAWGRNLYGSLDIPGGLNRVMAIAAGEIHTVALTLQGPIDIEQNPTNQSVVNGSNAVFSVVATGQEPLSYQWFFGTNALADGSGIVGANSHTLTLIGTGDASEGLYRVAISNAFGSVTSSSASLAFLRPPTITYQTPNQILRAGANITLLVSASGTAPVAYLWSLNGTNFSGNRSYLTLTNLQANASGIYSVLVTNLYGSARADISLVVTGSAPYITRQPYQMPNQTIVSNLTVAPGGTAGWSVEARGSLPLTYQWRLNGMDLPGATNPVLTLTNLTLGQSGFYNVIVRNAYGEAISAKVLLNVRQIAVFGSGPATNVPSNLSNVIAVAAGNSHVLVLKSDRSVVTWGGGALPGLLSPTNIPAAANNVIAIAANNETSMALRGDGRVVVWGGGGSPALVTNVPAAASNIMAIACGDYHCLALNTNGTVIAWGGGSYGVTTVPRALSNDVVAVAAGQYHNLVLKRDGKVVAWGNNFYGQTNVPTGLSNVIAIAAGQNHNLALKSDGQVVAWGNNSYGQINVPSRFTNIVAIAAGNSTSMALLADGSLSTWGYVLAGSPAINPKEPVTNVIAIAASQGIQWPAFVVAVYGNGTPFFTLNPVTQNATNGGVVQLHARAVGVQPMSYQWQLNGVDIESGTNGDLTIANFHGLNSGAYRVIASNRLGVGTSRDAWVKIPYFGTLGSALNFTNTIWSTYSLTSKVAGVWFPQSIETHDGEAAAQSGAIGHNQTATLQTMITGPGTLTFWWKVSSEQGYDFLSLFVDGSRDPRARIGGEVDWNQISCAIPSGVHTVTWVYGKDGSVSSGQDAGWVDQVTFVSSLPGITQQPLGQVASLGDSVVLTVAASGETPLKYQWAKDGAYLAGASDGSLRLANVSRADSGVYSAKVWNSFGSVVSSNAAVRVRVPQRLSAPERQPDGSWRWSGGDVNGGLLKQSDLDVFEAQASTNLADWVPLPGALTISNGCLLFEAPDVSLFPQRFYRVIER